jgi:hypothetical protein
LLRCLYLDADPRYYEWIGYITDEGRWIQEARNLALYGQIDFSSKMNFHLFMAPMFQLSNYLVFELFGVSVLTTRLLSAFSGSVILVLFWVYLRRVISPQALLVGVLLLAVQSDLIALSRVAVPEMVVMTFEVAVYFLIVAGTPRQMLLAGAVLLLACGMKASVALLLPVFALVIVAMPGKAEETRRWRDLMLFVIGFSVPALFAGSIGYLIISDRMTTFLADLGRFATLLHTFVGIANPYLYHVIRFPFEDPLSYTFNLWLLGVWLTILVWWANGAEKIDTRLRRYLATAGTWFALYFLLMLSLKYFPTRYKIHVLIPMALFISVGVSVIQRIGVGETLRSIVDRKDRLCFIWLFTLGLPTAVFFSPLLLSLVGLLTGVDCDRLSAKLFCFVFLSAAVAYLAQLLKGNRQAVSLFVIFPFVEALIWLVSSTAEKSVPFWPITGFRLHAIYLSLEIFLGVGISFVMAKIIDQWSADQRSRMLTAGAICYFAVALIRLSPGYVDRHYSIRDSSQDLGRVIPAGAEILTLKGETLFNGNDLRYSSVVRQVPGKPDFLVVVVDFAQIGNVLENEYSLIKSYNLWISPEYGHSNSSSSKNSVQSVNAPLGSERQTSPAVVARVYQRIPTNPIQQPGVNASIIERSNGFFHE